MALTTEEARQGERAVLVYITVKDAEEASVIATELVQQRLVACANIVTHITSVYEWEGQIVHDSEALLLAKTRSSLADAVRRAVVKRHSYEVPAISVVPIDQVHRPYMEWLLEQTSAR